ncbi:MAG: nucleotide exchange factor GrpE [Gammaproteobacteria bacterium]|nr:nucleotide exchange factor GrpE [Gammaproteobacteria bacterium]
MTPEKDVEPQEEQTSEDDPSNTAAESAESQNSEVNDTEAKMADDQASDPSSASDPDSDDPLAFITGAMAGAAKVQDPDLSEPEQADQSVEALQEKLKQAEQLAQEHWDRLLRMQAEHENQTKRTTKQIEDARKYALESLVNDLLPVKDSLEMGLAAAQGEEADLAKIVEGSDLTLKMLAQTFEKYRIVEINPVNEKFDPEFHQAMSMQEVEGHEPNTVASVFQKGYTLNERLIRPALVMVAK